MRGEYIEEAVKVPAWSPELARRVAVGQYPLEAAI
jgi:hypothetical protein